MPELTKETQTKLEAMEKEDLVFLVSYLVGWIGEEEGGQALKGYFEVQECRTE